jgi:hypothetical protein
MRRLRPSSEAEMVALFLRTELPAARFRDTLRALLQRDGLPERVITDPDLDDDAENQARLRLLTEHREYGTRTGLFGGFPDDVRWQWMAITPAELARVRYVDYDYWVELSGGTRLAADATPAHPRRCGPVRGAKRLGAGHGAGGRPRGPVPAADPGHHRARRRPGGTGGPRQADRLHAGPRPAAAGTGGAGRFLSGDDPLGVTMSRRSQARRPAMITRISTSMTVHGTRLAIRITSALLALMVAAARHQR